MHLDRVGQGMLMIKINDLFYPGKSLSSKKNDCEDGNFSYILHIAYIIYCLLKYLANEKNH